MFKDIITSFINHIKNVDLVSTENDSSYKTDKIRRIHFNLKLHSNRDKLITPVRVAALETRIIREYKGRVESVKIDVNESLTDATLKVVFTK